MERRPVRSGLRRQPISLIAFASGMAATATIVDCLEKGSHVIVGDDVYGGTRRLFDQVRRRSAGIEATFPVRPIYDLQFAPCCY